MSGNTVYYLEPDFKYNSFVVPFIMLVPSLLISLYIIKGNNENFETKKREHDIIKKQESDKVESDTVETDTVESDTVETENDGWDITEYVTDKYDEVKNYIKKKNIVNNNNGNKTINVRYNIEEIYNVRKPN